MMRTLGLLVLAMHFVSAAHAQESPAVADARRPAAIAVEGVPAVPDELFERQRQYQNVRTAGFQGWAPDGQGMLIATRFGNSTQLHRVDVPGGRREQVTFFDEPTSGRFVPAETSGAFLAVLSSGGDENDQVYLVEPRLGSTTLLTDGKSRNLLGPVRHDGQAMIVHHNRRNGRDTDLYIASTHKPDAQELLLQVDGQHWQAADWSLDGKQIMLRRYVSANESYPAVMDVASKKIRELPLAGDAKRAAIGPMKFTPDGKSAYLTTDARGEFHQLARLDIATGAYTWLSDDLPWDVDAIEVEPKSGAVAFTTNSEGFSTLYLIVDGQRREVKLLMGIIAGLEFSPSGTELGFTLARPNAPADAYSLRLKDDELTRWTFSEAGGLNPETFVEPTLIRVPSFDKREIRAFVYRPRGASAEKPAPVLIQIHGGPESQYRPLFSGLIQYWVNELGLTVICPNVRGSAGYGKTYLELDNGPLREDSVKDIGALLDWIAEQPDLDKSRVGVTGGSYGGYMVLASLAMHNDRLKAGMDHVGIANFITFLEQTSAYRQDLRRAEYGDERDPEMRAVFERINPTSKADQIRAALLVAHGENDPRVPVAEARQIAEKVRAAGRPVWTVYAANEGHGFAKKDNRDYLTAVEAMFLREYLIGN